MENPNNPINPTGKKKFPWGWVAAGCGALVVLSIVVVAVIVLVAYPAFRTALANQQNPSIGFLPTPLVGATTGPTPSFGATIAPTPQPGTTTAPNLGTGSGTTLGSLPFTISAVQDPTLLSGQSLMDQMATSLNLNTDTDFMAPKSYQGTIALDPSTSFTVGNGWCAKDSATLQQNLASMQFQVSIDGNTIDLSKYPTLYFTDNQGESCAVTGVNITPNGTLARSYHVVLTQKFVASLSDGITASPYPAGDVTFDFTMQFQVAPSSGGSSS